MALAKLKNFEVTILAASTAQSILKDGKSVQSSTILLQADSTNTGSIFIGDEDSQLLEIVPGQSVTLSGEVDDDGGSIKFATSLIFASSANAGNTFKVVYTEIR